MTSTITEYSNTIDINFPVPGKALSTIKEFHSNFNKIEKSLQRTANEISQLGIQLVNKTGLNNFDNNIIKNATLKNHSYSVNNLGLVTTPITNLDYNLGIYHKCRIANSTYSFNIINWPSENRYAKIRVEITNDLPTTSTSYINFSSRVNPIGSDLKTLILAPEESEFFDIWTSDSGENIFVQPLDPSHISTSTVEAPSLVPFITSISPSQVGSSGGDLVTIEGGNFGSGPRVVINGNQFASIESSSTSVISFYSQAATGGAYQTAFVRTTKGDSNVVNYWVFNE